MASPSPHSYLVLRDHGKLFPRGSLVTLEGNEYRLHTHSLLPLLTSIPIPAGDLAVLTEKECVLLDAVDADEAARYAVYSTPGKLQWGVGLQVGDTVLARLPERRREERGSGRGSTQGEYATVIIRWKKMTEYDGHRFGVEIMVSDVALWPGATQQSLFCSLHWPAHQNGM